MEEQTYDTWLFVHVALSAIANTRIRRITTCQEDVMVSRAPRSPGFQVSRVPSAAREVEGGNCGPESDDRLRRRHSFEKPQKTG